MSMDLEHCSWTCYFVHHREGWRIADIGKSLLVSEFHGGMADSGGLCSDWMPGGLYSDWMTDG